MDSESSTSSMDSFYRDASDGVRVLDNVSGLHIIIGRFLPPPSPE